MSREDSMDSRSVIPRTRDNSYFWRDSEDRYISTHRKDGCILIAEGLEGRGYHRTPEAIKKRAKRHLKINIPMYPENGMRKCICCGRWDARDNTQGGRAGFCPACWARRKAEAMREGRDERRAESEYQREKKRRRSERKNR